MAVLDQVHGGSDSTGSHQKTESQSPNEGSSAPLPEKKRRRRNHGAEEGKRYACDYEGCTKSFSRPDHLNRHKLNHNPTTIFNCDRCTKTFVRQDLLSRHSERHDKREKEKGEESGELRSRGDGAAPRKRAKSAKDAKSQVPTPPTKKLDISTIPTPNSANPNLPSPLPPPSASVQNAALHHALYNSAASTSNGNMPTPPFPAIHPSDLSAHTPSSTLSTMSPHAMSTSLSPAENAFATAAQQGPSPPGTYGSSYGGPSPTASFGGTPNLVPPSNIFANSLVMPSPFQADASSHNNTTTTNALALVDGTLSVGSQPPHPLANGAGPTLHQPQPHQPHQPHHVQFALDPSHAFGGHSTQTYNFEEPFNLMSSHHMTAQDMSWLFDASQPLDVHFAMSRPASPGAGGNTDFLGAFLNNGIGSQLEQVSRELEAHEQRQGQSQGIGLLGLGSNDHNPLHPTNGIKLEPIQEVSPPTSTKTPIATLSSSDSHSGPGSPFDMPSSHEPIDWSIYVDSDTRTRVLDYLGPEWGSLRSDPRMSARNMTFYLDLFWVKMHETTAPAVHRASFRPNQAPTPLLLSMMLLGTYFAPLDAYQLSVQLHPWFRGKVFCSPEFRPRAEIWLHQTVLLIVIFGKLCSTRMDHEMAHIFWSSCITLAKRSGLFSQLAVEIPHDKKEDVEFLWRAWIQEEVAKRLAQIMFAVDVEHAAFFRHSHTLSAFQVQLQLPCDEDLWDAPNAHEWKRLNDEARPPIQFISALKACLTATHDPPSLNPFSRIAVLHGLLSVSQDLHWRDHVLGFSNQERRAQTWRDMISSAYNTWKQRLDGALVDASPATRQLLRASISLYATAQITFSIDIHELQIYAGAQVALGLVVTPPIYHAAETRIRMWSSSKEGRASTWHASHFLRSCLMHWQQSTGDLAGCLHHRWAVYIACLAVFAFGRSTSGPPAMKVHNHQEAAMRYLDQMCTNTPDGLLAVPNKQNCLDLCETVRDYISDTRWELVQEAGLILQKIGSGQTAGSVF
ncbi:uncharacterized protein JCM6883_003708 [Sporobolomyces salmoneus]|uniref:uncharacterized protein n=1 Tax=Sporobolomyces salmoneus TaxID=183962 RepID=UPI003181B111